MNVGELRAALDQLPDGSDGWPVLMWPNGFGEGCVNEVGGIVAEGWVEYGETVYTDPEDAAAAEEDDGGDYDEALGRYEGQYALQRCLGLYGRYFDTRRAL